MTAILRGDVRRFTLASVAILAAVARWSRPLLDTVLTPAVVALVTSLTVWQWQQGQLQRWSSLAVVDIDLTNDKVLAIHNAGVVGLSDLGVYVTTYTIGLKTKKPGELPYITGEIESFSKVGGPLKHWDLLPPGQVIRYGLTAGPALKNLGVVFHDFASDPDEGIKQQYAFRVMFLTVSPSRSTFATSLLQTSTRGRRCSTSPRPRPLMARSLHQDTLFSIRKKIRGHQADLFDDAPQDLYP